MAVHFEKLAEGCRALAGMPLLAEAQKSGGEKQKGTRQKETKTEKDKKEITIEEVRAVLAAKSQEGKTREVKTLLMKYDAGKLSGVKPKDYWNLLQEAEAL